MRWGGQAGFSLVEALVGLALLSLVLTLSLGGLLRMAPAARRLEARREAERAAEAVLEAVRSGALVPIPGRRVEVPPMLPAGPLAAETLRAWLDARRTEPDGLLEVSVLVRYRVAGTPRSLAIDTLSFRPRRAPR